MGTQPERLTAIAPGTPMWKAVPPRLVGPYLTGQRSVLAGYVYRAQDVRFHNPAEAYLALSLGWEDSEFTPHMSEIYLVAWLARAIDGYAPASGHGVPEFYIRADRDTRRGGHVPARPGWRSARGPLRRAGLAADGAVSHAIPAHGYLLRRSVPRRPRPRRQRGDTVLPWPAAGRARLPRPRAAKHWRKQVDISDLDALRQSRLVGEYRGEPCVVLDDLGDRLHIAYQGRDSARARQLGYWEIDREVFEVVVARQDITEA